MAALVSLSVGLLGRGLAGLLGCPRAVSCSNFCIPIRRLSLDKPPIIPPKRPLTAYLRYVVEQQPILFKQKPATEVPYDLNGLVKPGCCEACGNFHGPNGFHLSVIERTKWIAQAWRQLTADQKQPYEIAASDGKAKYKLELAAFKAQLTPTQLAGLKEEKRQKLAKLRTMRQKRKLTMLGKPKRPRTAFNIFMAENFEDAKGATSTAKLKNLQDEWQKLSDTQKQMYRQLAEDDKIRYQNEIKSWEEQMIETGHEDVIRRKKKRAQRLSRAKAKSNRTALQTTPTKAKASKPSTASKTAKAVNSKKKPEE